jgi:hypothetical protein
MFPRAWHRQPEVPDHGKRVRSQRVMPDHVLSTAGVIVALAFFVLIAYVVTVLRGNQKLAIIIGAITALAGALPAILYALYAMH